MGKCASHLLIILRSAMLSIHLIHRMVELTKQWKLVRQLTRLSHHKVLGNFFQVVVVTLVLSCYCTCISRSAQ